MPKVVKKKNTAQTAAQQEIAQETKNLSNIAMTKIESSLKDFSLFSEEEREKKFGAKDFFEQFWESFKQDHPNLLDEIDSQDKLTIYVQHLEKMGFSLDSLVHKSKELHKEFQETLDEKTTIEESLTELKKYCDNPANKMPASVFADFASDIGLETSPHISVLPTTTISKIGQLFPIWTKFLEDKGIDLKDHQKSEAERILSPGYLATERLLLSATIKKLRKQLPPSLAGSFDATFPLPIDIHSSFQNLKDFARQREIFLDMHKADIDETLAKKLDNLVINNGDIYKELSYEHENIEWTKGFSEQTKRFRQLFNGLVTRQLFDESKEKGKYIEKEFDIIGDEFKKFPPYFNELFAVYKYNHQEVIGRQPGFQAEYAAQEAILAEKETLLESPVPEDQKNKTLDQWREECLQAVLIEKEKLNDIKRRAYAAYISTKEPRIGSIVDTLAKHKFDMSVLSKPDQQTIINLLVEQKLGDSIKNKIPSTLGLEPHEYQAFIKDLFDLEKKDIILPTQYGDIPLHFEEKTFFGGPAKDSMEIGPTGNLLTEQTNLPLNFKIHVTEQNKDFFENNIVFADLFEKYNNQVQLNDSYEVSVKNVKDKEGTTVKGYLSKIPPSDEIQQEIDANKYGDGWFLYSEPLSKPGQTRTLVTWDGKPDGDPVVIPHKDESDYQVDILSRDLNLNGQAIGGLLFSHVLGQYNIKNDLSVAQEKKLAQKFGAISKDSLYKDTVNMVDTEKKPAQQEEAPEEDFHERNAKDFLDVWKSFKGYQTPEKTEKTVKPENRETLKKELKDMIGSRLLIKGPDSNFLPSGASSYLYAEVTDVDLEKGIFKLKFSGNETSLGKYEGTQQEFSLSRKGIDGFKDAFEYNKIFKLPKKETFDKVDETISLIQDMGIGDIANSFNGVHWDGHNFVLDLGKESGQKVSHFGWVESVPGESQNEETKLGYMYKIDHDATHKKFKITYNDEDKTQISLDYPNFILFVADRKLQAKTDNSSKGIDIPDSKGPDASKIKKWKPYSIASIMGLFKNFSKKIGDGLKKYEEEQVEELTESVFYYGKLYNKLAGLMPSEKLKDAFGNAADEYMAERDNKVWKKIEKYEKFFSSDPDFGGEYMWNTVIKPYLDVNNPKPFKDHHQAAGLLLATIKKGKGPYSRNTDWAGKGMRVRIMFGEAHQKRYLLMKEKLERELQQGYNVNGQTWADDLQDEILKLEMKYITHCIDGRQLRIGTPGVDDTPRLEAMYSKKYAGELETEANKFFSETASGSTKEKGYSFELARFEFFRLLGDRPQQALPCLKQMAAKAATDMQWKVFESAVLTGMLSGVFYNITQDDKGYIKKICRTIGFLPGLWIKDPNHHRKAELFIKIATGKTPVYGKKENPITYNSSKFVFGKGSSLGQFKDIATFDTGVNSWFMKEGNLEQIAKFGAMTGKNFQGKTIIDLINDPKTPSEWLPILKEVEENSLEKDEDVDNDVKNNMHGLKQNILAKSQSLIDEITDFDRGKFRGKDKDAIQGMQTAWAKIAKDVPKSKLDDKNEVIYILKKFMNWFEGRGFNIEEKKFLVRGLLTVKDEIKKGNTQSADDILWYMIVGNVIKSSGNGQAPGELTAGMEAFKDFFKANLDTILNKDVIKQGWDKDSSLADIFAQEIDKGAFKVAPWDEYSDIMENNIMIGASKEENKRRSDNRKKYNVEKDYINKKLYTSAKQIEGRNFIGNKFKDYTGIGKKSTSSQLHDTLKSPKDIRIKNPEIIEKTKKRLSGELAVGMTEEEAAAIAAMGEQGFYDNGNDFL